VISAPRLWCGLGVALEWLWRRCQRRRECGWKPPV
jgi:hypothetical protein